MSQAPVIRPDPKLVTKYYWSIWLVFLLGFAPYAALAFIPELGTTFLWWYLAANALWLVPALLLVAPYYRSISYELREHELVERKGIITRVENLVPYRMVTNMRARRGPLDRLLGLGTLEIHTAGYSQQTSSEARMAGLVDVAAMRQELLERVARSVGPQSASQAEAAPGTQDDTVRLLTEIRDELRAQRRG